jgi:hypothetical protein
VASKADLVQRKENRKTHSLDWIQLKRWQRKEMHLPTAKVHPRHRIKEDLTAPALGTNGYVQLKRIMRSLTTMITKTPHIP